MNKKILFFAVVLFIAVITVFVIRQARHKTPKINNTLSSEWMNSKNDLKNVRSAVVYQNVTEGSPVGKKRSADEIVGLLKETKADFIFRGFWRWDAVPESPQNIPPEIANDYAERMGIKPEQISLLVEKSGYNYEELEKIISATKKEKPGIIFVGAIPAQRVSRVDKDDITGKIYTAEETWAMAFDPQKWNIERNGKPFTKKEFQAQFAGMHGWAEVNQYDPNKVEAYFPDITNPDYQELFLSWAYRQIDAGADAIWIDGLPQTSLIYPLVKDVNHPIIKDLYKASEKIIDEIHKYGQSKGRRIYVGSWGVPIQFIEGLPYSPSNVDFVTVTPNEKEIQEKNIGDSYQKIENIRKIYGNTPVFAVIDWGVDPSPTTVFSQKLSKDEQKEVLQRFDETFAKKGVNFIYPLHGGYLELSAKILAFGKYRNYDSLAPEFDTYETIKKLALNKAAAVVALSPTPASSLALTPSPTPSSASVPALSSVKSAIIYQQLNDRTPKRSIEENIRIFKDLNADFIFRGVQRWYPIPESKATAIDEVLKLGGTRQDAQTLIDSGYTFEDLKSAIVKIKQEDPNIIFTSGISTQRIGSTDKDDFTGEILGKDKTYAMALDPGKWGLGVSKVAIQKAFVESLGFPEGRFYFPDITNSDYQNFFVDTAKKQIDIGADAILLFSQAVTIQKYNKNSPGVKESFEASSKIVDMIHEYGLSKGKYIYVGTWAQDLVTFDYPEPKLDFVTSSPKITEVVNRKFDDIRWQDERRIIAQKFGSIPHFVFLDWGFSNSPLQIFATTYSKDEQKSFLRNMTNYFNDKGMKVIYPVHGGELTITGTSPVLAYGKYNAYDSLAPEFNTYETIKELVNKKISE